MDVTDIIDPLNDAQREAVTAAHRATLVLAGAGSGKTRVLVHRIAWLVRVDDISPKQLFAVTFTNKAASEMRQRIESAFGISHKAFLDRYLPWPCPPAFTNTLAGGWACRRIPDNGLARSDTDDSSITKNDGT